MGVKTVSTLEMMKATSIIMTSNVENYRLMLRPNHVHCL